MLIPVRCNSCGFPIGGVWENYKEKMEKGEEPEKILDELGLERYCCRAIIMTHVDTLKDVAKFRS